MNANALPDIAFPGRARFVTQLDVAVRNGEEHQVTAALRTDLSSIGGEWYSRVEKVLAVDLPC